jgi:hypothetical protein
MAHVILGINEFNFLTGALYEEIYSTFSKFCWSVHSAKSARGGKE